MHLQWIPPNYYVMHIYICTSCLHTCARQFLWWEQGDSKCWTKLPEWFTLCNFIISPLHLHLLQQSWLQLPVWLTQLFWHKLQHFQASSTTVCTPQRFSSLQPMIFDMYNFCRHGHSMMWNHIYHAVADTPVTSLNMPQGIAPRWKMSKRCFIRHCLKNPTRKSAQTKGKGTCRRYGGTRYGPRKSEVAIFNGRHSSTGEDFSLQLCNYVWIVFRII